MSAIRKDGGSHPCSTCAHAHYGKCSRYIDAVTGEDSPCVEARRQCDGTLWKAASSSIAADSETYTPLWAREDKTYRD